MQTDHWSQTWLIQHSSWWCLKDKEKKSRVNLESHLVSEVFTLWVVSSVWHQTALRAVSDLSTVRYVFALFEWLYNDTAECRELYFRPARHVVSQGLKVSCRKIKSWVTRLETYGRETDWIWAQRCTKLGWTSISGTVWINQWHFNKHMMWELTLDSNMFLWLIHNTSKRYFSNTVSL